MTLRRLVAKKMYAVSARGVGLISGTMGYSRREAIELFRSNAPPGSFAVDWGAAKRAGYRTVCAMVKIVERRTVAP